MGGVSVNAHKDLKGLKTQNLRDHMSEAEFIFTALAELSTRQMAESVEATGMAENKSAARQGGRIAKKARLDLESKTGQPVVTGANFLRPLRASAQKQIGGRKNMNEAETRAEHIDPALKAAGWGVVDGSRVRREYMITPGRIEGHGRRAKPLTRRLRSGISQHQARRHRSQGVGRGADRRRGAGQELRRKNGQSVLPTATNGQGIYAIDMETGKEGETAMLSHAR